MARPSQSTQSRYRRSARRQRRRYGVTLDHKVVARVDAIVARDNNRYPSRSAVIEQALIHFLSSLSREDTDAQRP